MKVLTPCYDDAREADDAQEEPLTEREWQRIENTMRVVAGQQAKFETNLALADRRFAQAEKRMHQTEQRFDRLERLAERVIRRGERRMTRAEAEITNLRAALKSFLQALRRSAGNGRAKP